MTQPDPRANIPGQRPSPEEQTPFGTVPQPPAAPGIQWLTVAVGAVITTVWVVVAFLWGISALLDTVFGTIALVVLTWVIGWPLYLLASKALADKEITGNEFKAMFKWPIEVALLAMSGGNLRDTNGNRQFAQQIQRENDNSDTKVKGWKAYAAVGGLCLLAFLLVGATITLFVDVLLTLAFLAGLLYVGGMLLYFWTCGLIREPLSGKLMWTLAVYPWDMFKKVLGTV